MWCRRWVEFAAVGFSGQTVRLYVAFDLSELGDQILLGPDEIGPIVGKYDRWTNSTCYEALNPLDTRICVEGVRNVNVRSLSGQTDKEKSPALHGRYAVGDLQ